MFTGIIEKLGEVKSLRPEGTNLHLSLSCPFTDELKIDQSLAHNGVCLTVVEINGNEYTVTAIEESLQRTSLGSLKVGDAVNLERCMPMNGRLDGHLVQGHVDTVGTCLQVEEKDGSWEYTFEYPPHGEHVTVPKGSITVNGTSLTVVRSEANIFSVAIIPYTYENTVFKDLKPGHKVNLEFDVVGKYVARLLQQRGL
jgi:riboflavin synthase